MPPRFSNNYLPHAGAIHAEHSSEFPIANASTSVEAAYLQHLLRIKLGPLLACSEPHSMLVGGISHVVDVVSFPQMRWINARRVVALVEDIKRTSHAIINRHSFCQTPSSSVGKHISGFPTKKTVASFVNTCRPEPAWTEFRAMLWDRTIFVDLWPKSISNWLCKSLTRQAACWCCSVFQTVFHNVKFLAACWTRCLINRAKSLADHDAVWNNYRRFDVVAHIVFSGAAPYREAAFAFQYPIA